MKKIIYSLVFVLIVHCTLNIEDCMCQWEPDVRLTNDPAFSYTSYNNAWCIASSGSVVHVVWHDYRDGNREIYYKRSTNAGVSWGADVRLTNNTDYSWYPSIAVFGSVVHVAWYEGRDGNYEIYYKRSTEDGISWGADTRLTNNTFYSGLPSVAVSGSLVHVVWFDLRDGNYEIYYKCSTDGGIIWGADTRLTNEIADSWNSSVAVSGSVIHVVWSDKCDGYGTEIYYKRSTDAGLSWGTDTRLTNNYATSGNPSVSVSGSAVHVVWHDNRDGNFEIYYKRNPTGNVGIQNISTETPASYSLSQNYPNPFNPTTKIKFDILAVGDWHACHVQFVVFDILGKEVATLVNEQLAPGTYSVDWNAGEFPSGIYFYRLQTENFSETKRMTLIK